MGTVSARATLAGAGIDEAAALWFALERRPTFIDGFGHLDRSEGAWPCAGSRIVWISRKAASARVAENVIAYEPRRSQAVAIEDAELSGTQIVRLDPRGADCQIELELRYRLKRQDIASGLADVILIRRRQRASLRRTLARFAIELAAEQELHS